MTQEKLVPGKPMGTSHPKQRPDTEKVLVCFGACCVSFNVSGRTDSKDGSRTIGELRLAIAASKELSDGIAGRHFGLVAESLVWKQRGIGFDMHAVVGVSEPEEYPEICSDDELLEGLGRLQVVVLESG